MAQHQPQTTTTTQATPREAPWAQLRSAARRTFIYEKMVRSASPDARPGDAVAVYDKHGALFGHAHYNPNSRIRLRMLNFDDAPIDHAFWSRAIEHAVRLRTDTLRLDERTNAYRLLHAEGDDLSGLVVDRYDDTLTIEVFSLGMWRIIDQLTPILHAAAGTRHHRIHADERARQREGFAASVIRSQQLPKSVRISENGVRFRVHFDSGHKTGFFCDQRDNRQRLAQLARGADVLDACCYSGAFGLYARTIGQAAEVTCVDLDETAIRLAADNANLNQVRVNTVHADAFAYMRQMHANDRRYDIVVLDPPKFVLQRRDIDEGARKYIDLNRLAAALVKPGGILLACSCSGLVSRETFLDWVTAAAWQAGRRMQLLEQTTAAPDHPVSPLCPESAYLKAVWTRLT